MSRYNFKPSLVDHCQISVLVRPCNGIANEDISSVIESLSSFQFAKIQNSNNRIVRFKFHRGLQSRPNDWWKLQTHRNHFGLIGERIYRVSLFDIFIEAMDALSS